MDAPPVQYARTKDGFNIACNVAGVGPTLLMMPYPFTHAMYSWTAPGLCETSVSLAQMFRVVHFDARGQGLSSRGLPKSHRLEDYLLDVDAVVDALKLDTFCLFSGVAFWRAAVAYAASNPERVSALVLLNPLGTPPAAGSSNPGDDWDTYLFMLGSTVSTVSGDTAARLLLRDRMKECINPDDWRKMQVAFRAANLGPSFAALKVPTLVLKQPGPWSPDATSEIAAAIPGAKLQLLEDHGNMLYSPTPEPPPGVTAICEFLDGIVAPGQAHGAPAPSHATAALSSRQREVLGLIAAGRTTREIAATLVLSERTVERHVADLYAKIGARNRAEATAYAARAGLL
jgi:DNA-binding CsgD family transcriptional regulator/pimeloyl-ACP methyl ester carboxylesterase